MRVIKLLKFTASVFLCLGIGALGAFYTTPSIDTWYQTLKKPSFTPPNWVFGPVWTLLYILMGIALYLLWVHRPNKRKWKAYVLFFLQLFLNFAWSYIFFGLHNPHKAFVDIMLLFVAVLLTINEFIFISYPATYLLVPYLLWIAFASLLNFSIMILN